jgi:hypothetical protein
LLALSSRALVWGLVRSSCCLLLSIFFFVIHGLKHAWIDLTKAAT